MADGQTPTKKLPAPKFYMGRGIFDSRRDRLERMRSDRGQFYPEWQEISDYIQIRRGKYLMDQQRKNRRSKKVLNEAATFASRTLGAGMLAGVSSPSRPWLKLLTPDPKLNEFASAKRWLDISQRMLYRAFQISNYYHVKQTAYRDMGDFGQGPIIIDEDFENAINCVIASPGEYFLDVNHKNQVDVLYREFKWSTMQCLKRFGYENCPTLIKASYDRGNKNDLFNILHAIEPNDYHEKGAKGVDGMAFSSVYVHLGSSGDDGIFEVKGYNENPISCPRWDVMSDDVYGDGPGSLMLPAVKALQALERRSGQLVDKVTAPNLALPSSMRREVLNHNAGQPTYFPDTMFNGQGGSRGFQLYQIDPHAIASVSEQIMRHEQRINTGYFTDLFLMLEQSDRRQITAREIEERHEEKLIALGPVLERTHYEGLNVEVDRTFGILVRKGVIPPPPPEMEGMPLKVEYTSLLAVAQKSVGVASMERFAGFIGNLSAGNPNVLDKWDMDQTVDEYSELIGVPASIVRSDEEADQIRKARQAKEQQAQQMAMAQQGADTAKVLSETDTQRGGNSNLLADLLGGAG